MGFWSNLFGTGKGPAYFLDDDSAKTYGDINYMRKEIVVERTYPKGKADDIPVDKFVPPAMDGMGAPKGGATTTTSSPTSSYSSAVQSYTPPTPSYTPPTPSYTPPVPQAPAAPVAQTPEPAAPAEPEAPTAPAPQPPAPKTASDDMDMFRNMARNIRR